jgi:thiamine pyrophosphokinase
VVGDLDSLSSSELAQVPQAPGFELLTFPRAKDQTDFELLWPLALERLTPSGQVAIVAGLGGRWDMTLANLLLPWARPWRGKWRGAQVVFWGQEKIYCLQGPACLPLAGDSLFSLLPALGQAGPITLTGQVAYPLQEGYLKWGHTRGVSNETGPQGGSLTLARGSLLVTVAPKTPA